MHYRRPFLLPLALLFMLPPVADATGGGDNLRREFEGVRGNAGGRFGWFYGKRAFPADTVQHGYLGKALDRLRMYPGERTTALTWESIGPRPASYYGYGNVAGRIPALAVHPTNPSIVYAGAAAGGVWKTTDGGITWVPKTDFLASLATGSIAIDPGNPQTVYWGTGEPYYSADAYGGAGIFMTTDGGSTWSSIGLAHEKRIPDLAVDPHNGNTLFAATWGGIYRTTDRGGTWEKTLDLGYGYDVAVHPTNSSIVYAGIGDNTSSAGIYKSVDNGRTWTPLTNGLPSSNSINRLKIEIAPSAPSTLYALMSSRSPFGGMLGLYRSANNGNSWTRLAAAPDDLFGGNNQGWYDLQLGVSPANAGLILIGGLDIHRSTNSGSTWANISGGTVHVDQHAIAISGSVIYAGNDGGIWKSTTGGASWTNLNAGLAATQFYSVGVDRVTPARVYGGTQDNGTQRTAGSMRWTGVIAGDGGMVVVHPTTSDIVFGESQNGNLYRSLDGGMSFSFVYGAGGVWVTPLRFDPSTHSTIYTANTRVLRSTNLGESWNPISAPLNGPAKIQWLAIHPFASTTIYAASNDLIFRTTDGGETWQAVSSGLPSRFIERVVIDPNTPSTLYATLSGTGTGHVYRSMNEGGAWSDITGDLPDIPAAPLVVHPGRSTTLYLGTDCGLFITTDGGGSWLKETGLPNAAVADLALTSDDHLVAATHGRGMFRAAVTVDPAITVADPAAGERRLSGSSCAVRWTSAALPGDVCILLSRDGGTTFPETLSAVTANDGVELWMVSDPAVSAARIRIASIDLPPVAATSALFAIGEREPDSLVLSLSAGWNMISLPYTVSDPRVAAIFPDASSSGFAFTAAGYAVRESLAYGEGYWMKFAAADPVVVGVPRECDTLDLVPGWNVVGSIGFSIPVDGVGTIPPGIVLSPFIGQEGPSAVIEPGRSYWVNIRQEGKLILRRP